MRRWEFTSTCWRSAAVRASSPVSFRDITQRKAQEAELARLTRIHAFLSLVNQAIARAASPEEMYSAICRVAVEQGGFGWAWIGHVDADTGTARMVASAGTEPAAHGVACSECTSVRGVIGSAGPISCRMQGTLAPLPEACVAAPIVCQGRVRAVLTLVSADTGLLESKESALLETVSRDISFAREKFEAEARQREAEEKLRKSELLHRSLFGIRQRRAVLVDGARGPDARAVCGGERGGMRASGIHTRGTTPVEPGRYRRHRCRTVAGHGRAAAQGRARDIRNAARGQGRQAHSGGDQHALPGRRRRGAVAVDRAGHQRARHRVEAELRASQARYHLIVENIADVVWTLDLKTLRLTYTSPSVVRLRGYTAAELANTRLAQSLTPESYERALRVIQERLERIRLGLERPDTSWTDEFDLVSRDGDPIPVEVVTRPVVEPNGTIREVVGVTRSIQERRRAQQALRDSEEKFRLAFMMGADAFTVADIETGVIRGSQRPILRNLRLPAPGGDRAHCAEPRALRHPRGSRSDF